MRIAETYSHLNGLEYLLVHKPKLWKEIQDIVSQIDAHTLKPKISKESRMQGKELFAPKEMNKAFKELFEKAWLGGIPYFLLGYKRCQSYKANHVT